MVWMIIWLNFLMLMSFGYEYELLRELLSCIKKLILYLLMVC